jgi:hypothetical protein
LSKLYYCESLLYSFFLNFRIIRNTAIIAINANTRGIKSDSPDVPDAAACSPAATTTFPVPEVILDDASLASTVPPVQSRL